MRPLALIRIALLCALALSAAASAAPAARAATTSQRIVAIARAELGRGVREVPDGSNRGARIRMYGLSTVARFYPAPWCAYFASYVTRKAGVPIGPGGRGLGYVPYIRSWARQTRRWTHKPRPGYLITFPQHVGIVETVAANGTLTTIEGNAGNAVRRRFRRWGEATGYVRLAAGGKLTAPGAAPGSTSPSSQALKARITAYPGWTIAAGQTVDFTANDSSGAVARADWDLSGSGRFSTRGDNVSRRYATPGPVTIRLRITDRRGKTATATRVLTVRSNQAPVARLRVAASVQAGAPVTADASASVDPDGSVVRYAWDADGSGRWQNGATTRTIRLTTPGDYTIGLRVYDNDGNMTETRAPVRVTDIPPPVLRASCAAPAIPSGQRLTCHADTTGSPLAITRVQWDLNGDGTFDATGTNPGYTYRTPGAYTVQAKATDARGRVATATVAVTVSNRPPVAKLSGPATSALGQAVTVDATASSDPDGKVATYAWDLDGDGRPDGAPAAAGRVTFTPAAPGSRVVRVWVADALGGVGTATLTLNVTNRAPVARIAGPTRAVAGTPVTLDATASSDPDGQIAHYDWDLDGNGSYETPGQTTPATFATPGYVTVGLRVTDAFGATGTKTLRILVQAPAPAPAPATAGP